MGIDDLDAGGWSNYEDLESLHEPFDLALVVAPVDEVPGILAECGRLRAKGAVVFTRGDLGPEHGRALGRQALAAGLRLIGPRSWGIINPWIGLYAGLTGRPAEPGGLAVISQSAALCAKIVDLARCKNIGLALAVGVGDMSEVDCADILDYVAGNARVRAILLHLEQIDDLRKFMSSARAGARLKPIMVLKTGRGPKNLYRDDSPEMVVMGEDDIYEAVFQRAGLVRVKTVEGLFSCGDLAGRLVTPKGGGLIILTNTRSPGVIALDHLHDLGIDLAVLPASAEAKLKSLLGERFINGRPVNMPVEASPELWTQVLDICQEDPAIDGTLVIITPQFMRDPVAVAQAVTTGTSARKPLFAVWMGGPDEAVGGRLFVEAGIPTYDTPEAAIQAYAYLRSFTENMKLLQEVPPRTPRCLAPDCGEARRIITGALAEGRERLWPREVWQLLMAYGLPVINTCWVRTVDEALSRAEEMGYPVQLAQMAPDGQEPPVGAVDRIMENSLAVKAAWHDLAVCPVITELPESREVLLRKIVAPGSLTLRAGCRLAGAFGPVVFFGLGGIRPELALDTALGLPPLNRFLARMLVKRTRVGRLLADPNLFQPEALSAVEEILVQLAALAVDLPEVAELEIEPLLVIGSGVWAQQASVRIQPTKVRTPMHLIICPYPSELETVATTKSSREVFIRPLKPEDAQLYQDFWNCLSSQSIIYRFSRSIKVLTQELMIRFTQLDYDREIALVALDLSGETETMLAVARLNWPPGSDEAEFAVIVGDPWQGLGVGAELLRRLILIAQKRGIKTIWGLVMRQNKGMIELARKLGFSMTVEDGGSQLEIRLDLPLDLDLDNHV